MGFTIVAKAGGSDEAPENTCEAFAAAARAEPPSFARLAFEVDVRLSKDEKLFALHDATLDRTTDGRGPVAQVTASELALLCAGPRGERIPKLEEVIEVTRGHELVIEPHDARKGMLEILLVTLGRFSPRERERLLVASEQSRLIRALRARAPKLRTAATAGEAFGALMLGKLGLGRLSAQGRVWMLPETHRGIRVITPSFVETARRAGDPVWVYVVNHAAHALTLRALGVDGCFTTRPRALARELKLRELERLSE